MPDNGFMTEPTETIEAPVLRTAQAPGGPGMRGRAFDPRLLEGSIPRSLFLLAIPIMGGNILQIAYQLVDAFWVGRLGAAAVASVSVSMPLMFLMMSLGMGFTIAGSTLIAHDVGARNRAMVDHVAGQTMLTVVAVSAILGAFGFVVAPYLLELMEVAADVYHNALVFLRGALGWGGGRRWSASSWRRRRRSCC